MRLSTSAFKKKFLLFITLFCFSHTLKASAFDHTSIDEDDFYMPPSIYPLDITEDFMIPTANDNRVDLTALPFVTIDPAEAHELDDALYAERTDDGGFHIAIAIADPTHFIESGSDIALEARRRGFTLYGETQSIPMLPSEIVSVCSLDEGETRPCIMVDLVIDRRGNFQQDPTIYRALIHSRHKLSYADVQDFYQGHEAEGLSPPLQEGLTVLRESAQALGFYLSGSHKTLSSQAVVSTMMITANNAVAFHLKQLVADGERVQALYRTQRYPGDPARYTTASSYHASLNLNYTHFTSPLRRYADMMVHWLLFNPDYDFTEETLQHIETQQYALGGARL